MQLEAVFSYLVAGCLEEEADLHSATTSCQRAGESVEVMPQHSSHLSGLGFEQPGLREGVPAYGNGVATR